MLVSEKNSNSHMYDIENFIKVDRAKIFAAHQDEIGGACSTNGGGEEWI
jgi:hypothetical protein